MPDKNTDNAEDVTTQEEVNILGKHSIVERKDWDNIICFFRYCEYFVSVELRNKNRYCGYT